MPPVIIPHDTAGVARSYVTSLVILQSKTTVVDLGVEDGGPVLVNLTFEHEVSNSCREIAASAGVGHNSRPPIAGLIVDFVSSLVILREGVTLQSEADPSPLPWHAGTGLHLDALFEATHVALCGCAGCSCEHCGWCPIDCVVAGGATPREYVSVTPHKDCCLIGESGTSCWGRRGGIRERKHGVLLLTGGDVEDPLTAILAAAVTMSARARVVGHGQYLRR